MPSSVMRNISPITYSTPVNLIEIRQDNGLGSRIWNMSNTRAPANTIARQNGVFESDSEISSRAEIQRVLGEIDRSHIPFAHSLFSTPLRLKRQ